MTNELEMRDCYYVYRALHDGVCPDCGTHGKPEQFEKGSLLQCPDCGFHMTGKERDEILSHTKEILKRRVDNFMKFRDSRR
jgi:DNA-directed RNA polymerase subunit RPC12/RpoP